MATIAIFGRLPALGMAELESLYGHVPLQRLSNQAAFIDCQPYQVNFARLGGSVKLAQYLMAVNTTDWAELKKHLLQLAPSYVQFLPASKLNLGLSVYGLSVKPSQISAAGLELKKVAKSYGKSIRLVPNKELELSSAQVYHNKLTADNGSELLLIKHGNQTILAQTVNVQDIDAYVARDRLRPKRDARVGMLPPKLAQTITNLAVGKVEPTTANSLQTVPENSVGLDVAQGRIEARSEAYKEVRRASTVDPDTAIRQEQERVASSAREQALATKTILDPFCGTGVILQEAALMGYDVYGTDLEQRMVDYSKVNLDWLGESFAHPPYSYFLDQADATDYTWKHPFDTIASESYLGQPFSALPSEKKLQEVRQTCDTIIKKFLLNLASQTKVGFRLCLAVPAWKTKNGFSHLPLIDQIENMGYNRVSFVHISNDDLLYYREGQVVARELLVLERT